MLSKRLASLLNIRTDEISLVVLVGLLFMCLQAGAGMGDNAATALFLLRLGANFLPYMYLALGGLNFVLALGYAAGIGRFKKDSFFLALIAGSAVLLLLERVAIFWPFPALYPAIWLTMSGIALLLGTFLWNLAGEVCDARQAKRLFPLFTSAGILGSVLGNLLTGAIARALATENLIVLYAALLGVSLALTHRITKKSVISVSKRQSSQTLFDEFRLGFDFVRKSQLMRLIAYASILFSILFFGIAFPFNKVASASFTDEAQVAGFLGLFTSVTTGITFLVSLFLANRMYSRLGIVNSVLLMPIAYIFGFVYFGLSYTLTGAVAARFVQLVVLSGVAGTAWNALFNVVPSQQRGQVLAFQNGVPSQIGVVLSGLLLIFGERILTSQQILWVGIPIAFVCGILVWRMRFAYGDALLAALRAGRVEVFRPEAAGFAGFQNDPLALRVALKALQDPKLSTRRLAVEMLTRMNATAAVPALITALTDSEASVRSASLRALGDLKANEATASIYAGLEDEDYDVRLAGLIALRQIEARADLGDPEVLVGLLDETNIRIRLNAAAALVTLAHREDLGLAVLMESLGQADAQQRVIALDLLVQVAENLKRHGRKLFDGTPIESLLGDVSSAVRRSACSVLGCLLNASSIEILANCLHDSDISVRNAAAISLRAAGDPARPFLLAALKSPNGHAQDAVLEVLEARDPDTLEALHQFVGREIIALHQLRHQIDGFPGEAGAPAFLRETLRRRLASHEDRLIKAVGIVSNPRAMELIRKSLNSPGGEARAAAMETFETLGDKRLTQLILPVLEEVQMPVNNRSSSARETVEMLLSDDDHWIRAVAARAVAELDQHSLISRLRELKSDRHPVVAHSARESLAKFGEEPSMDTLKTVSTVERILLLREVPIFEDLSPEDLGQIAEIAREQVFSSGATLCLAGEEGREMFIIVSGQVEVQQGAGAGARVLATRAVGEIVGEMAIIESVPRVATLRALGELRVLVIDAESFNAILRDRPEVSISVLRTVSRRLRELST